MRFDLKTLVLEGPDCSGKTTAYSTIHKKTKFKWNIHDRSTLSMLCYAIMYGRNVEYWRSRLLEELNDLNNVIVVLMPPLRVIIDRLKARGDEFQTVDSICKLYDIFDRESSKLSLFPNVLVCRIEHVDYDTLVDIIEKYVPKTYDQLGQLVESHASASSGQESVNLTFTWADERFKTIREEALENPKEIDYYSDLEAKFTKKISDELNGLNEYMLCQPVDSRRFVIAQDTCISFVQALARNDRLRMHVVCRSSNTSDTFKYDVHFIAHLGKIARSLVGAYVKDVYFSVTIGSAHIIR